MKQNRIPGQPKIGSDHRRNKLVDWLGLVLATLLLLTSAGACTKKQTPTLSPEISGSSSTSPVKDAEAASPTAAAQSAIGMANAGSQPMPTPPPQVYTVQAGDTLSSIARQFGIDLDQLIAVNGITNPNLLQVGQQLQVPTSQMETGPDLRLLPNSEFVNSPAYVDFDIAAFVIKHGGYLLTYEENVGGRVMNGPEIVNYVVDHYSVGPRMLLAILELESGWVTNPSPSGNALLYPMGYTGSGWDLLHRQLAWAADRLNQGYYDWRGRGMPLQSWGDGTSMVYAPTLNAATAGLQYFFSLVATKSEWEVLVGDGPGSFIQTYRQLFGEPSQYAIEPLIPGNTAIPELSLPWAQGEMWYYTGGPHGGWADGSAWSAIDFVPDEGYLGCQAAASWATAAAPGLIIHSENGEVKLDLDGDGHDETGWVLFYLHVASHDRVPVGTRVKQGDLVGHPSCEGGFSESTHLHLARKYNGEWIAADGPLPLVLSGWQFASSGASYEGTASRGPQERTACECRQPDFNGLVADR